ncbi:hypothetical protein [Flectobacillus roseus]|uniref:SEC-C domain-containing protein n=1 Tax=Flectobacillus roseus TaxID=502259 RepID=A0ABT6Y6Z3_9BACT|nr:hypothetical protein [Flectobacillus roseus]MDI9859339.1 hypothetical protein [Flectobacillus roseus]
MIESFYDEALSILPNYPKLNVVRENNLVKIFGELDLFDLNGIHQDTYNLEIIPTANYPFEFPLVYEIGNKIPNNIDWHVHTDGHFCIKTIPEEKITCCKGIKLNEFIEFEIKPYLFNQTFRRLNGYFLNERSHGLIGEIEFYQEVFKTKSITNIIKNIHHILTQPEPNRVSNCYCGSDMKYRKCHRDAYQKISSIGRNNLEVLISRLIFSDLFFEENPLLATRIRQRY